MLHAAASGLMCTRLLLQLRDLRRLLLLLLMLMLVLLLMPLCCWQGRCTPPLALGCMLLLLPCRCLALMPPSPARCNGLLLVALLLQPKCLISSAVLVLTPLEESAQPCTPALITLWQYATRRLSAGLLR